MRVAIADESARVRKSTGTSQRLSRRNTGAGSEASRPATDTTFWFSVNTIDCPRAVMVNPPASRSSRDVVPNVALMSSTATYSWLLTIVMGIGLRPSRESTVMAGGCAETRYDTLAHNTIAAKITWKWRWFTAAFPSSHAVAR